LFYYIYYQKFGEFSLNVFCFFPIPFIVISLSFASSTYLGHMFYISSFNSPDLFIHFIKYFWAWDRIWDPLRVTISSSIFFQFLPYNFKPTSVYWYLGWTFHVLLCSSDHWCDLPSTSLQSWWFPRYRIWIIIYFRIRILF